MKIKTIVLTTITFTFLQLLSQDLNVDGNVIVQGNISAENNRITNVADPNEENDAVNLRTLSNSGMKPSKIYGGQITDESLFTVPSEKIWKLEINTHSDMYNGYELTIVINGIRNIITEIRDGNGTLSIPTKYFWLQPNYSFYLDLPDPNVMTYYITIFEYDIQSSGNDQGLNYVIP